ncbi:hypothetical protein EUB48_19640 [Rhodoferax sediminis]|uniref:Uncharacterized protein n=1 Tax=Rhodoferax sediminis TaxID=2509614 RepID=A0A515DFV0_9BURK|nr:hypothetical protein EUB48_19640 [Rhodoferax sediminis]
MHGAHQPQSDLAAIRNQNLFEHRVSFRVGVFDFTETRITALAACNLPDFPYNGYRTGRHSATIGP